MIFVLWQNLPVFPANLLSGSGRKQSDRSFAHCAAHLEVLKLKKTLSLLLALATAFSASVLPTASAEKETAKPQKTVSVAACDNAEGWRNTAAYESTFSVDTENKEQGNASIKLTSAKEEADADGIRGRWYIRTANFINLDEYTALTFKLCVDHFVLGNDSIKITLVSEDEKFTGYSFTQSIKLFKKGWHDISLDLTNLPDLDEGATVDKTKIKRIVFTWYNTRKADNTVFNIDDIRLVVDQDKIPTLDSVKSKENAIFGDIDLNGSLTATDALLALKASVGTAALSEAGAIMADVDDDDAVSANDALMLLLRSVKKDVQFDGEISFFRYLNKSLTTKHKIQFNSDGKLKILEINDIHNNRNNGKLHAETASAVTQMLDKTKPDLVILNGDTIMDQFVGDLDQRIEDIRSILTDFNSILAERNIYWLATFGNHDAEHCLVSRIDQIKIYESLSHCLSFEGYEVPDTSWEVLVRYNHSSRCGNTVTQIYDSTGKEVKLNIWCIDTGVSEFAEPESNISGDAHAYILPSQIEWYKNTSACLEAADGRKVPGMMFGHIPLPEFKLIPENPEKYQMIGKLVEGICSATKNTGMFDAMKERGDILSYNAAHDHNNAFSGIIDGIELSYPGSLAYDSYGGYYGLAPNKTYAGCRLITVDESNVEAYKSEFVQYVPKA